MPNNYSDQFFTMDPYNPPPVGTTLAVTVLTLTDSDGAGGVPDGDIDANDTDAINGIDITNSYPGDTVTIDIGGGVEITYTGTTFYLADGTQVFTPTDGQVLQQGDLVSTTWESTSGPLDVNDLGPPCFTPGTMIQTPTGDRNVEDLEIGDLVETMDHGPRPIMWIGSRQVAGSGDFAPIRIASGHLSNDRPLLVSPQHRILLRGWRAEMLVGEVEVLVAAKHLIDDANVRREPCRSVTYLHVMLDGHEILFANGCPCESFDLHSDFAHSDEAVREELSELFPEMMRNSSAQNRANTVRPVLRGFEASALTN